MEVNNMHHLIPFLNRILNLRDPQTGRHSEHVTDMALILGKEIELSSSDIDLLEYSANLHDIGKIVLNDMVISKPGRLTEAEYYMVQQHTVLGYKVLEPLGLDPQIGEAVLHHHENFDGSGYPDKLIGEAIPLLARIIRITDTYDALVGVRGYRKALTHKEALKVLEKDNRWYDPALLGVFMIKMTTTKH